MLVVATARSFRKYAGNSPAILKEAGLDFLDLSDEGFDASSTEDRLAEALRDADAAIVGNEPITAGLLSRLPKLKAVTRRGIGYDSVDTEACRKRGIAAMRTTGAVEGAVAEHVFAYMLYFARRVDLQNLFMQNGKWTRLPMPGLDRKTLGLVGFGGIGKEIARRAKPFGMEILYFCRHPKAEWEAEYGAKYVPFDELLERSDYLSVNVPLTPGTRGMFGPEQFSRMKDGAVFINIARGPVADARALRSALDSGKLGGAGVDVFDHEPCEDSPLMGSSRAVLTPHTAVFTETNSFIVNERAAKNIAEWSKGTLDPKYRIV
ncbi:MAG: phosphoglycerate dehydrogenase [Sutterellaceae bacterium]|nr:phosphoglycerate dehydrogenase [Sutterellaceae bacterium]MDD7441044.1 phosphoglycerate dehydrogenase [Sutterellaceae bacterium]MDY2867907.1 phosphoglycerate dehydrogenase [Mesosutterella sp.]